MSQNDCCTCLTDLTEAEMISRLDEVIEEYRSKPGALIPVLQIAQGMFGYLPQSALKHISLELGKPFSEVAGVASFYSFFSIVPRGKHLIRACLGTACYVRGGKHVLGALKKVLGVDVGETTPDKLFTLEVGRCFGACGLAPVVMIDNDTHQRVKAPRVQELLERYKETKSAPKRSMKK
jgi:NADH:ubiquinone oxidoreductase subunit E